MLQYAVYRALVQCKCVLCRCLLGNKLAGNSQTGHWGHWYDQLEPALVITNAFVVDVEVPTLEAGSACKQCHAVEMLFHNRCLTGNNGQMT